MGKTRRTPCVSASAAHARRARPGLTPTRAIPSSPPTPSFPRRTPRPRTEAARSVREVAGWGRGRGRGRGRRGRAARRRSRRGPCGPRGGGASVRPYLSVPTGVLCLAGGPRPNERRRRRRERVRRRVMGRGEGRGRATGGPGGRRRARACSSGLGARAGTTARGLLRGGSGDVRRGPEGDVYRPVETRGGEIVGGAHVQHKGRIVRAGPREGEPPGRRDRAPPRASRRRPASPARRRRPSRRPSRPSRRAAPCKARRPRARQNSRALCTTSSFSSHYACRALTARSIRRDQSRDEARRSGATTTRVGARGVFRSGTRA